MSVAEPAYPEVQAVVGCGLARLFCCETMRAFYHPMQNHFMRIGAVLFLYVLGVAIAQAAFERIELVDGWQLRQETAAAPAVKDIRVPGGEGWLPVAKMPASVHDGLRENGKIGDPCAPGEAEKQLWVAESGWLYARMIEVRMPVNGSAWLDFQGLDGIVDVYLNGELIASHENMFMPLRVEVSARLRASNALVLHFKKLFELVDGKQQPIRKRDGDNAHPVRRPNDNYINYLGAYPYFCRMGVFREIALEATGGTEMADVTTLASLDATLAHGTVKTEISGPTTAREVKLAVRLLAPGGKEVAHATVPAEIKEGRYRAKTELSVEKPALWWPRGYGAQPLYKVEVALLVDGREHQTKSRRLGFRRIEMPELLHFTVNGMPVRLWGGCWVTPKWDTPVWDQRRAEKLFDLAANANFNVFRVWGVVETPPDEFYELADARGILLWQDFANLPLAPDAQSLAICRTETAYTVKRLRHHASVLSWCGGNENALWSHTEYNQKLEERGAWNGETAGTAVGAICRELDPDRYYQPTSPYYGIDPNDPQRGNTHGYTNVWYVPGYDYLNFASEDTRIAAPVMHSLKRMMAPADLWPADYSPVYSAGKKYPYPESWLRYTTSISWKKTGPVEQFYDATDADSLVYRLGMAESLYYQDTVERQRRGRAADDPTDRRRCGGYIVWKFNDSWPQIYSAKVDYYLEPLHAYYALKRAYAPVMLSFEIGAYVWLWAVNDSPAPISGKVTIQLFHLDQNRVRREIVREVTLAPGKSAVVVRLDEAGIGTFRREHILSAKLTDAHGVEIARATALADIERRIDFPAAKLDVQVRDGALVITTDKFARAVTLTGDAGGDAFGWFFEDNYFDLVPGETKTVRILGEHRAGQITARAQYSPHATTLDWKR